ncbi:MAG: hypothetical protein ACKVWR_20975 [Acidimicrobiales bacterium]
MLDGEAGPAARGVDAEDRTAEDVVSEVVDRRTRRRRRRGASALALAILAGACTSGGEAGPPGGDDPTSTTAAVTHPAPSSTTTTTDSPPLTVPTPSPRRWRALGEPGVGGWVTGLAVDPAAPSRLLVAGDLLGVGVSEDRGANWSRAFGLRDYEMSRFTFVEGSPGEVWAASMGGPYRSLDGGLTWELRRQGMGPADPNAYSAPIEVVVVDPGDPVGGRLIAFGGSHRGWLSQGRPAWGVVWESLDRGGSWRRVGVIGDGAIVTAAVWAADGVLLAAADGKGLYRSRDGGRSWSLAGKGLAHRNVRDLAVHPARPGVVWAALGRGPANQPGGVWRSDDGGQSFTAASVGLTALVEAGAGLTSAYEAVVAAPSNPEVLYTADVSHAASGVFRSDDGGASWRSVLSRATPLPPLAYGAGVTAFRLAVDPTDADRVYLGNTEHLLGSADGGLRWTDLASRAVGPDETRSWRGRGFSGLVATGVAFDPATPGRLLLSGFDGAHLLESTDGGRSWRRPLVDWDSWGGAYGLLATPAGELVLLGQDGVFNGIAARAAVALGRVGEAGAGQRVGSGWTVAAGGAAGLPEQGSRLGDGWGLAAAGDGSRGVVAAVGGGVYRSDDGGRSWRRLAGAPRVDTLTADAAPGGGLYAIGDAGVLRSTDGGASFSPLPGGGPTRPRRLTADPRGGALYVTEWRTGAGGLWRFADGAWTKLRDDDYAYEAVVDPRRPGQLLLVTNDHPYHDLVASTGVWRSVDGGGAWSELNDGLADLRVVTGAFDPHTPGRAVIGGLGGGFWIIDGLDQ